MTASQLYTKIYTLQPALLNEVNDFIDFLKSKQKVKPKLKERKFGCAKGQIIMHPDFDEPLEDFKDYM